MTASTVGRRRGAVRDGDRGTARARRRVQMLYQWEVGRGCRCSRSGETFWTHAAGDARAAVRRAPRHSPRRLADGRRRCARRYRSDDRRGGRALAHRAHERARPPDPPAGDLRVPARAGDAGEGRSSTRRSNWRAPSAPTTPCGSSTASSMPSARRWNANETTAAAAQEQNPIRSSSAAPTSKRSSSSAWIRIPAGSTRSDDRRDGRRARRADRRAARGRADSRRATAGRILAIRSFGKANFLVHVRRHARASRSTSGRTRLSERDFKIFKLLDFGDWVGVEGRLFRTRTNELTIWASSWSSSPSACCRCPRSGTACRTSRSGTASAIST